MISVIKRKNPNKEGAMPDDKTIKQPLDAKRVNINEPYEVNYWCKKWGCTPQTLRQAVNSVGTSADAVAKYLGK